MSVELAYAAGLFDGEGCVLFYYSAKRVTCGLSLSNCDIRALYFMQSQFGGRIRQTEKAGERGKRYAMGVWEVNGELAENAAQQMLPFSKLKTEQLELFLEAREACFAETVNGKRGHPLDEFDKYLRTEYARLIAAFKRPVFEGV
jgi:hypothetical protein